MSWLSIYKVVVLNDDNTRAWYRIFKTYQEASDYKLYLKLYKNRKSFIVEE